MLTQSFMFFVLPLLVVFALIMFMMRRMGGVNSPMQFGRSRGKLYAQEDVGITFDDVAGIDEAVEEVREIVDFLKHPEKYQKLGGRIPRGVLLVGPPEQARRFLRKQLPRGWRPVFLPFGFGFRRDVRWSWGRSRSRYVSTGYLQGSFHHLHRRTRCSWKKSRWQCSRFSRRTGANAQRIACRNWMALTLMLVSSLWLPRTAPKLSTQLFCGQDDSTATSWSIDPINKVAKISSRSTSNL